MILGRIAAGLLGALLMLVTGATAAHGGVPPVTEESFVEDDAFLFDCGDFDLRDRFTFTTRGKVFFDDAGNPWSMWPVRTRSTTR